jgi:8-oxo-dGTP diphosphatase
LPNYQVAFCTNCGTRLVSRLLFGRERMTCPACGWIHFEDPKVAAAVLVERGDEVLLVRRLNEPCVGFWTVPAGFIDAHEDPARAAERECLEETGLVVAVTSLIGIISGREHPGGADMVLAYRAWVLSGQLQAGDDAGDAAYFPRSALPPLAFRATRVVLGLES